MDHFTRRQISEALQLATGRKLPGFPVQGMLEVSGAQHYELGSLIQFDSGGFLHRYRYSQIGTMSSGAGKLYQSPVPQGDIDLIPTKSFPVKSKEIEIVLGRNSVYAGQYSGGTLYISRGNGRGQTLRIKSHPAALAGATCVLTCTDGLTIALNTADSRVSLGANPFGGIIVYCFPVARVAGVPLVGAKAGEYCWVKTRGPAAVLMDGVAYVGDELIPSSDVGGAVTSVNGPLNLGLDIQSPESILTSVTVQQKTIGSVLQVNRDGDYCLVDLRID